MNTSRIRRRYVACLTITLSILSASAALGQNVDPSAHLRSVERTYNAINAFEARFDQQMTFPYGGGMLRNAGLVRLKGDQYRIDMDNGQSMVNNGTTSWVYTKTDNQVLINDVAQGSRSFTDYIFRDQSKNYRAERAERMQLDGRSAIEIHMSARDEVAMFPSVTLWTDPATFHIYRARLVDINGTIMVFDLSSMKFNETMAPDVFNFEPPADASVVDLRRS